MSNVYVYLAGPITGCVDATANGWRDAIIKDLVRDGQGLVGVSPLRCEPPSASGIYEPEYEDFKFGTPQVIAAKNRLDVLRCDVVLAYMPTMSIGTLQEIGWAVGLEKPVVLITDLEQVLHNPVIRATVPWRFHDDGGDGFDNALEVIRGIFEIYT